MICAGTIRWPECTRASMPSSSIRETIESALIQNERLSKRRADIALQLAWPTEQRWGPTPAAGLTSSEPNSEARTPAPRWLYGAIRWLEPRPNTGRFRQPSSSYSVRSAQSSFQTEGGAGLLDGGSGGGGRREWCCRSSGSTGQHVWRTYRVQVRVAGAPASTLELSVDTQ